MCDILDLFEHWNRYGSGDRPAIRTGSNDQSSKDEIEGLGMAMGLQAQKMPKEMVEAIQWAEEKKPRRKDA